MLRGLIWNCRGISDVEKRNFIREHVDKNNLDFVGIQETMKTEFNSVEL